MISILSGVNGDLDLSSRFLNCEGRRRSGAECLGYGSTVISTANGRCLVGVDGAAVEGGRVEEGDGVLTTTSGRDFILICLIAVGVTGRGPIDGVGEDLGPGLKGCCWDSGRQGDE